MIFSSIDDLNFPVLYFANFRFEIGSDSPATGIVVLLAAAKMLADVDQSISFKSGVSNIMFAFLNGESFEYIGSSKMVYDMINSTFPPNTNNDKTEVSESESVNKTAENKEALTWPRINLRSLKFVLELGQLQVKSSSPLYAHMDTKFNRLDLFDNLSLIAKKHFVQINEADNLERGLPPASLQTILKERRGVPGIFLSNFNQQYSNKYYHSPYDNFTLLKVYDGNKDKEIVEELAKGKLFHFDSRLYYQTIIYSGLQMCDLM